MRLFLPPTTITLDSPITLTDEPFNHVTKVLRMGVGQSLTLCDGEGTDYTAVIAHIEKKHALLTVSDPRPNSNEPTLAVTLVAGLPKGSKIDTLIQKTVELGVAHLVFVETNRSNVNKKDLDKPNKRERLHKIALAAAQQSQRGRVPTITLATFEQMVAQFEADVSPHKLGILCYEAEGDNGIRRVLNQHPTLAHLYLFTGPEGGFTPAEVGQAKQAGIHTVSLGPRILRTETAGIIGVGIALYAYGDMEA